MQWLLVVAQALSGSSEGLLRQPVRKRLLGLIKKRPGIHASEICRETGEAWGTVQYHLGLLRKGSMVTSLESGRERRFFPSGMDEGHARLLSILNQGRRQEIATFIREHPGIRQIDVCRAVGVSRKTFRASVEALVEAGLVVEQKGLHTNRYFPEEPLDGLVPSEGRAAGPPGDIDVA